MSGVRLLRIWPYAFHALLTPPNLWLGLQQEYDLWPAAHESKEWQQVKAVKELASLTA
jgi:plasmid maintenance system antidote protein VapI